MLWAWWGIGVCLSGCAPASGALPPSPLAHMGPLHTQFGAWLHPRDAALRVRGLDDVSAAPASEDTAGLFLVQCRAGRVADVRAALIGLDVVVHGYFPEDAWSIGATPAQVRALADLDGVAEVSALPLGLKLAPSMVRSTGRGLALAVASDRLTLTSDLWVELATAGDAAVVDVTVQALGGHIVAEPGVERVLRVVLPRAAMPQLARMSEVLALEPWSMPHPGNDVAYGVIQSGDADRLPAAEHGLLGQGQVVGLSDSGVDVDTCWFGGDKIAGYVEFTGIHDGDGTGHGTHVAGSIAGNMGGGGALHAHNGMAPEARLFVEDVGAGANLVGIPGDLGALFEPARVAGAHIHSNSWAGQSTRYGVMSRALDRYVAEHPDFLPVFAVGNTGRLGSGSVSEPALAKNVLAVGASDGAHPDTVAGFSSRGPTRDGRIKPTIVAPGVGVVSAQAGAVCATQTLSGTSMATPVAAGGVALVRQYYVEGWYPGGRPDAADAREPSAALLRATLVAGAVEAASLGTEEDSGARGFGRMQLDNTLKFDADATRLRVHDETQGLIDGQDMRFTIPVARSGHALRVALTWTDPPAVPGAARALVNDLDLEITGPDGTIYLGNATFGSAPGAEGDHENVEELVALGAAEAGDWEIVVRAVRVPAGPQNFAMVAVGDFAP